MGNAETGGLGGMLRDLKDSLGGLFGGGKLEPEQELTVQVMFALLGYLSKIDSIVTSHEADFINNMMDELNLSTSGREAAMASLERGRKRQIDIGQEIRRYLKVFPAGSPEVAHLFDSLLRLAASDGRIQRRERIFLEEVTVHLGYDASILDSRLPADGKTA